MGESTWTTRDTDKFVDQKEAPARKFEMARKGGVPANRVLNAMSLPQIQQYLRRRRRGPARAA